MKSDSLAKLFAVNLFRDEDLASVAFDQNLFNLKTRVVELLINNAERIGEGRLDWLPLFFPHLMLFFS